MKNYRILVTAKPMLAGWDELQKLRDQFAAEYVPVTGGVEEALEVLPTCDAWIADVETIDERVLQAGRDGRLRVLVRWGVGTDNVDLQAAERLGVKVDRTAGVFSDEVADLGIGYMIALARQIVPIDREVRAGHWPRPRGYSLRGKNAGIVGYGSIGQNLTEKLETFGLQRTVYSQHEKPREVAPDLRFCNWPEEVEKLDFLFLVCALTETNCGMISAEILRRLQPSASLINLGRGALIDELALVRALQDNEIAGAALDVYQEEPLPFHSPLRQLENVILGSHNASNTTEGATRASAMAVERVFRWLS